MCNRIVQNRRALLIDTGDPIHCINPGSCEGNNYQYAVVGRGESLIHLFVAFWDIRTLTNLEVICSQLMYFWLQQRYRNFEPSSRRHVCQLNYPGEVLVSDLQLQRYKV